VERGRAIPEGAEIEREEVKEPAGQFGLKVFKRGSV
jgi:hypothetical protein